MHLFGLNYSYWTVMNGKEMWNMSLLFRGLQTKQTWENVQKDMWTYEYEESTRIKLVKDKILDCNCIRVAFRVTVLRIMRLVRMLKRVFFNLVYAANGIAVAQVLHRRCLTLQTTDISHVMCMRYLGWTKEKWDTFSLRLIRFTSVIIFPLKLQLDHWYIIEGI